MTTMKSTREGRKRVHSNGNDVEVPPDKKSKTQKPEDNRMFLTNMFKSIKRCVPETSPTRQQNRNEDLSSHRSAARKTLNANFKMLKEGMDPFQVTKYLQKKGIVDDEFFHKFRGIRTRQGKVETLLIRIDGLLMEGNSLHVFQIFEEALKESGQGSILATLQKSQTSLETGALPTPYDEEIKMMNFFHEAKDKIIASVEPRKFLDDIVSIHGIDLQEYDKIIKKESREERALELCNIAADKGVMVIKMLCDFYNKLYAGHKNEVKPQTVSSSQEGRPVALRYHLRETVPTEDSTEHLDLRREIKEVQEKIINRINDNLDNYGGLSDDILAKSGSILERLKLGSIIFLLKTLSDQSIKNLRECCRNGEAVEWLKSILQPDDIKRLEELKATDGFLECYIDDDDSKKQMFDDVFEECFCVLSKDFIERHMLELEGLLSGLELDVINELLESETLDETLTSSLINIKENSHSEDLIQKLIEFLLQPQLKRSSFCFTETKLAKESQWITFLQQQQQQKQQLSVVPQEEQGDVSKTVKENMSKSVDILEEELDARWFCEYLESRSDEPCVEDILNVIQSSNSRTARTKPFVRFLCKEEDIKWFMEALDEYSPHLLDILTQSKDDKKLHAYRSAMLSVYDFMVDELEPLELKTCLSASTLEQLNFSHLEEMDNRCERATYFIQQCLKADNVDRIPDVMDAFSAKCVNIERAIKQVSTQGSQCKNYKCPRVEKHKMEQLRSIYKVCFTLPPSNALESGENLLKSHQANLDNSQNLSSNSNIKTERLLTSETKYQFKGNVDNSESEVTLTDKEKEVKDKKLEKSIEIVRKAKSDIQRDIDNKKARSAKEDVGLGTSDVKKHHDKTPDHDMKNIQGTSKSVYQSDVKSLPCGQGKDMKGNVQLVKQGRYFEQGQRKGQEIKVHVPVPKSSPPANYQRGYDVQSSSFEHRKRSRFHVDGGYKKHFNFSNKRVYMKRNPHKRGYTYPPQPFYPYGAYPWNFHYNYYNWNNPYAANNQRHWPCW